MKKNRSLGTSLIGLSLAIFIGIGGLCLSESLWSLMYQSNNRYQTLHAKVSALRLGDPFAEPYDGRADYSEMKAIEDSYQTQAFITGFALSLIWAGGGVFAARWVAQRHSFPPTLYLVAFGIIPGILAFIGWRKLLSPKPPAT